MEALEPFETSVFPDRRVVTSSAASMSGSDISRQLLCSDVGTRQWLSGLAGFFRAGDGWVNVGALVGPEVLLEKERATPEDGHNDARNMLRQKLIINI